MWEPGWSSGFPPSHRMYLNRFQQQKLIRPGWIYWCMSQIAYAHRNQSTVTCVTAESLKKRFRWLHHIYRTFCLHIVSSTRFRAEQGTSAVFTHICKHILRTKMHLLFNSAYYLFLIYIFIKQMFILHKGTVDAATVCLKIPAHANSTL